MVTLAPDTAPPPPDADTDAPLTALVERARSGDMQAWARLYQDHWARLLRHVSYLTGDVTAAEDLVQECFAQALASLTRFDARAPFFAWLRGIALNIVRKHWRTRGRRTRAYTRIEAEANANAPSDGPESGHLSKLRAQTLLAVLDELPDHLREAFVLCDLRDMSAEDAAQELGISPGNLRVRATRARARIRVALTELGWLSPASGGTP
jgi:RNA polymerase sigma-70 factor (ECF subfamily)